MKRIQNFIQGRFKDPVSKSWFENINPATGQGYSEVPDSQAEDVDKAVEAATGAFTQWSQMPGTERSRILNRIADLIEKNLEDLARAESIDQGKPLSLAKTVDIPRASENFRFFAGAVLHHQEQATDMNGEALNYSLRQPIGVAGLISPWNLPLYLLTWKIAPAIATGNTVVAKGSELTPMTAYLLSRLLDEAGLPPGVVNIIHGYGKIVGEAMTAHPRIPLISFTGGTQTAKNIVKNTAPQFKKVSLELGGKNPNLIFNDAPFEDCLETSIRSSFANQGEICLCGSRIFVQTGIYDRFLAEFSEKTRSIQVGNPMHETTQLGALVSADHREKIEAYIQVARDEGGEIRVGGDRPNLGGEMAGGYFLNPTIITGLSPGSSVMQEEIFGPVVTVTPFETEEEAISLANGVDYGLAASIWTQDVSRSHRVARCLDAGVIWVNTWLLRDLRTPFGGMKASGLGREGGEYSIDFFTEVKNICVKI